MSGVCPKCLLKLWRRHNAGAPGLASVWREQAAWHLARGNNERAIEALWYAAESGWFDQYTGCNHVVER